MSGFKPPTPKETGASAYLDEQNNMMPPANYPKTKKKKWEDDYKRATFYVQKDTMAAVEAWAGNEKGEKTRIINEALQDWLAKQKK